jgi:hypothetical protein
VGSADWDVDGGVVTGPGSGGGRPASDGRIASRINSSNERLIAESATLNV